MIGKTFGIATTALIASQSQALEWSDVTEMASKIDLGHLAHAAFGDVNAYNSFEDVFQGLHLTNRNHTKAKLAANKRRMKPLTHAQR